jgi:hypothetical protein
MEEKLENFVKVRRDICKDCEHNKPIIGVNTCEHCGCVIRFMTMVKIKKCPIGKWQREK